MAKEVHPFDAVAEQWSRDKRLAFQGNPISKCFYSIRSSSDTKVIGRVWPQTAHINLFVAHQLTHHKLVDVPIRFDRIELRKSAKLTDCISTAAISAYAFIVSARALEVFQRFDLGTHAIYPAAVHHKDGVHEYHVLHFVNDIEKKLDCARSRFHVTDMLGKLRFPIEVLNHKDLEVKGEQVHAGEYPGTEVYDYVRLTLGYFEPGICSPDIFTIRCAGVTPYISMSLADAISDSGLTGFKIDQVLNIADPELR